MAIHTVFIEKICGQEGETKNMFVIPGNYETAADILIKSKVLEIENQEHLEELIDYGDMVAYTSDLQVLTN